ALATSLVVLSPGGEHTGVVVADLAGVVAGAIATVATARRARRTDPATRGSWQLLALAAALWTLGELLWSVLDLRRDEPPFPSVADTAYLLAVPFAAAALLGFARPPGRNVRLRSLLDGLLIAASSLFVCWIVLG